MLDDESSTIRTVAWSEVCPWLSIFRTFRLAISPRILLLAAVAIFLTLSGWSLLALLFSRSIDQETFSWIRPGRGCPWRAIDEWVPDRLTLPDLPGPDGPAQPPPAAGQPANPFFGSWARLGRPVWDVFFNPDVGWSALACLVLCTLWTAAVWAFFGGAITRIAAVQLACDERVGWAAAIRYTCSKWRAYFAAPLFPLLGILLAAAPIVVLGLVLWAGGVGVLLAALIWPLLLLAGLVMAILLLGLVFGWPLMWGTISAEGTDSFDALSRSYAYVFGRPLHYLFYAIVAAAFGALGWLLVSNFAVVVVGLTYWAASWGCSAEQFGLIVAGSEELGPIEGAGAVLIHFWTWCVKLLAVAFLYGYFWTASTAIYFLLRRDVDATEMDEVFLDEDASEEAHGLPPLETDEAGAPVVADDVPEIEPDDIEPDDADKPGADAQEER